MDGSPTVYEGISFFVGAKGEVWGIFPGAHVGKIIDCLFQVLASELIFTPNLLCCCVENVGMNISMVGYLVPIKGGLGTI